jgi:hypothetical protein
VIETHSTCLQLLEKIGSGDRTAKTGTPGAIAILDRRRTHPVPCLPTPFGDGGRFIQGLDVPCVDFVSD